MPHLHLPADHDEHDRQMAAALARALRSSDLYVTHRAGRAGPSRPVVPSPSHTSGARRKGLARLFRRAA